MLLKINSRKVTVHQQDTLSLYMCNSTIGFGWIKFSTN